MVDWRRDRFVFVIGLLAAWCLVSAPSGAQTWPQRPVKLIVTLGPGSGVDLTSRVLADRLSGMWGQPVVIENRPGGDAIVAITTVIAANDDHILLSTPVSSMTAHPYTMQQVPYKWSDLSPIARFSNTVIVIAAPADLPVKSMAELVAMTKAQPGKLNWAGTTGAIDFLFAGFLKRNNLDMARVPYRNPQDASTDLATGRIQVAEASLATLRPQLQAGKIKLLATTATTRLKSHPELPTVAEAGFPELTLDGLVGLFGPNGMPQDLRERIASDIQKAAEDPKFEERLAATGQIKMISGPAEFMRSIDDQRARITAAAKDLGIAPSQ